MDDNNWGDEFEVEVTDLRTGNRSTMRQSDDTGMVAPSPVPTRPVPLDDGLAPTPVDVDRVSSAKSRRTAIAASVVAVVALVAVLLPGSPLGLNQTQLRATPTATRNVAASQSTFYAIHAVPWGVLKIDGAPTQPFLNGSGYATITLDRGVHILEYTAPPFPPLRCTLRAQTNGQSDCPTDNNPDDISGLPNPPAHVLDLRANVANLPAGQLSALSTKIATSLTRLGGHTLLQPGDHYLDASGNTFVANTATEAIVNYILATAPQPGTGCYALCDQMGMGAGPNGPAWVISASIVENWRYVSASQGVIVGPQIGQNNYPIVRMFAVSWSGGWQVTGLDGNSASCQSGTNVMTQDVSSLDPTFFQNSTIQSASQSANGADGCVISLAQSDGAGGIAGSIAYFLYRSAALVAVNAQALTILPNIPMASANEAQIAARLIASIPPQ